LETHYLYYDKFASKKTADKFFISFEKAKNSIENNPYFQIRFDEFRGFPLKKYPFLVFYFIDVEKKAIVISRIFHVSQNPEKYPQKK
jgi:hypothetical protein